MTVMHHEMVNKVSSQSEKVKGKQQWSVGISQKQISIFLHKERQELLLPMNLLMPGFNKIEAAYQSHI